MKSLLSILSEKHAGSAIMRGVASALTVEDAREVLNEMFGDRASRYYEVTYVKNGTLGILCHSSSAVAELKLNEANILAKISVKKQGATINKIRIIQ